MAQQAGPKAHNTEDIFYSWWTGLGGAGIDDLLVINITFRHTNACERTENNARCCTPNGSDQLPLGIIWKRARVVTIRDTGHICLMCPVSGHMTGVWSQMTGLSMRKVCSSIAVCSASLHPRGMVSSSAIPGLGFLVYKLGILIELQGGY